MSIRFGKIIRYGLETKIDPKDHFDSFDNEAFRQSMKRITPIKVRQGYDGSDF